MQTAELYESLIDSRVLTKRKQFWEDEDFPSVTSPSRGPENWRSGVFFEPSFARYCRPLPSCFFFFSFLGVHSCTLGMWKHSQAHTELWLADKLMSLNMNARRTTYVRPVPAKSITTLKQNKKVRGKKKSFFFSSFFPCCSFYPSWIQPLLPLVFLLLSLYLPPWLSLAGPRVQRRASTRM